MPRRLVLLVLLAGLVAAPAHAQEKALLMPGVTYERQVEFTRHGPVVMHVVEAPRPGGLHSLRPVTARGAIAGRETVSSMQRRLAPAATAVGVNGDLSAPDGRPAGALVQGGVLHSAPLAGRSALGIDAAGTLRVDRVRWFATWQGTGQRRAVNEINAPPGANGTSLYTPAWGTNTPVVEGATVVVLQPFPAIRPNATVTGTVVAVAQAATSAIPPDGAVVVARGVAAQRLAAEVASGGTVTVRLLLEPSWDGVVDAIGGGPVLVRGGAPVFRPNELFTTQQMLPRHARTAVGQRADGTILLVTVDGGRPGYSSGLTSYELAQAMARLGARTAMALEHGAAATLAFDGAVLNRPSSGEREVANGLFVLYEGVHAPAPAEALLTFRDGGAARQELAYKVVRPSSVSATLLAPDRSVKFAETVARAPGTYRYAFNGATFGPEPMQGRWTWSVRATDDQGRQSAVEREFWVNSTLRSLSVSPRSLRAGARGAQLRVQLELAERARVNVRVESPAGVLIRTLARTTLEPGTHVFSWDGRDAARTVVHTGRYLVRATAENAYGPMELAEEIAAQRVIVKPKPAKKKKQAAKPRTPRR